MNTSCPTLAASLLPLTLAVSAGAVLAQEDDVSSPGQAPLLDYALDVRYRFESVSQDNALADAEASTARSRLTLTGHPGQGVSAVLEVDNVTTIGPDHYDSLVRNRYRGTHAVVADPTGTDVNQLYLGYEWQPENRLSVGRHRIVHDNQRFIGGVAWRQNEQTYDGATLQLKRNGIGFRYSYVDRVQRIFGAEDDSIQPESLDSDSHLLLLDWSSALGQFSSFVYALDFSTAPGLSSLTVGGSWAGGLGPADLTVRYAIQQDHGDQPEDFRTGFLSLEGTLPLGGLGLTLGFERLGSDAGRIGFSTPLATLHMFQGWADIFLNTPQDGMEDAYLGLSGRLGGIALRATYHDYRAVRGRTAYGSEWNLIASHALTERISTSLKYANYQADDFAVDTEKLWFSLQFTF